MTIVRDVPIGPPRAWVFGVEVTGLGAAARWFGNAGGLHFEGEGEGVHVYTSNVTLQDVIRWEVVRVVGPSGTSDQLNVRHLRVVTDPATGATTDFTTYDITVVVGARVTDTSGSYFHYDSAIPTATASVISYGPDGSTLNSVDNRPDFISGFYTHSGGDGYTYPYVYKQIVNKSPLTSVAISAQARRWPSGDPIAGLDVTLTPVFSFSGSTATFPWAPITTGADGNALLQTANAPPGWPGDQKTWTGASLAPIQATARTQSVGADGQVHMGQPYTDTALRGNDDRGYFELWRAPSLLAFTRAGAYNLDNGQGAANWTGSARSKLGDPVGTDRSPEGDWQVTQGGDGTHAFLPTTHTVSSQIYGVKRHLSAAQGQATRQYRYLRVRLQASAGSGGLVALWTDWVNPDTVSPEPPVSARATLCAVPIAAGSNTFEIDLVSIADTPNPFGAYGDFYHQSRGWLGGYQSWNSTLPNYRKGTAADGGKWAAHVFDWLSIEGLTPGQTYVIQEVTLFDKAGEGRTPLRVLGNPMPGEGGVPFTTLGGQPSYFNADGGLCRVLANGRLVAAAPAAFRDETQDVFQSGPGSALVGGHVLSAQDLLDRWLEYYDAGAGVWNVSTSDAALAAKFPQVSMEPTSVTPGGFVLDALAAHTALTVAPGFDVTVSNVVILRIHLGGNVEGLIFDDKSRQIGASKSVRALIQQPPAGDALAPAGPITEAVTTADADGYFALVGLFQPQYWPNTYALQQKYDPDSATRGYVLPWKTRHQFWTDDDPPAPGKAESSAGRPYVGPADQGNPWQAVVRHRAAIYFYDLARFLRALSEQDMAQDLASGRILRVRSDAATGALTSEAREGRLGLAGAPARAVAPITDAAGTVRLGANPSLWVTHETGLASLVYARGDGTGAIVRADSLDGLITLGAESMSLFTRGGGYPYHFRDGSTGIAYVFAAFDDTDGTQSVRLVRQNALGALLTWADGSTEKVVAAGLPPAGRPIVQPNRYDAVQALLLMHGDSRLSSPDGGENWTALV